MSRPAGSLETRRFTVREYHRMAEAGILGSGERVELLFGVVCPMSPKNRAHVIAVNLACDLFREKLSGRARVYKEDPLSVGGLDSEPEPDAMVCGSLEIAAFGTEKMEPLLIVEVADSSLARDLGEKRELYAKAGIPEYWVVNLVDRVLEIFLDPAEGRYRKHSRATLGSRVFPRAWPDVEIEVASLFPQEGDAGAS